MSVATIPSPASRFKRSYEVEAGLEGGHQGHYEADAHRHKRTRVLSSHQQHQQQHQHRASSPAAGRTQALESAIASLLALFPGMDEKVVQDVLLECGSIDAAIKRLTDLKLSSDDATVAAAVAVAGVQSASAAEAAVRQQQSQPQLPANGTPRAASTPAAPSPADSAAAAVLQDAARQQAAEATAQAQQQQQQQEQQQGAAAGTAAAAGQAAAVAEGPQTAEQWVEFLVLEMLASKHMEDARGRAAQVLEHFERFVKQRHKDEVEGRFSELAKENHVLKRAVQIQAQRAQHKALAEEQQLSELRAMVAHYQEQCRRLELNNYSLAMHLQQATGGGGAMGAHNPRNPDVY